MSPLIFPDEIDSISGGGEKISDYFTEKVYGDILKGTGIVRSIKRIPASMLVGDGDFSGAFYDCSNLCEVPILQNTNVITNLEGAFSNCVELTTFPLWDTSNVTSFENTFSGCTKLKSIPKLNTANATTLEGMFNQCIGLQDVPVFDTSKVTTMNYMFGDIMNGYDDALSNESLNNILQMCINATNYTEAKTLQRIGLSTSQIDICKTLSNYQAFLDSGWTDR